MDFYKVLKYALSVVFIIIVGLAMVSVDDGASQPVSQQPQTKFNF